MATSWSPTLRLISSIFATIFIGFGINAIVRPSHALSFFEFDPPASTPDKELVESLLVVYGARDIFMGLAICAAATLGDRRVLGWILIAAGAVAVVDGVVCWQHGKGHWNHWAYAPGVIAVGGLLAFPKGSL